MPQIQVVLPEEELINWSILVLRITDAVCPHVSDIKGISCVTGKSVAVQGLEKPLMYELTLSEKEQVTELLPALPSLHGRMSQNEIDAFMEAYRNLANRLPWEPVILNLTDQGKNLDQRSAISKKHGLTLQEAISCDRVRAVDECQAPAKHLTVGVYIPREDAIKYLHYCGFVTSSDLANQSKRKNVTFDHQATIPLQQPLEDHRDEVDSKSIEKVVVASQKVKKTRKDGLTAIIGEAQRLCTDPYDVHQVWQKLLEMAEEKIPPLVGTRQGDKAIEWRHSPDNRFFDMNALRARLQRDKQKAEPDLQSTATDFKRF